MVRGLSLADAFEKLRWAKHHFEVMRPQIEAFEKRDAHRITVSVNHDAGEYTFYVHDLEPPDPDWGLVIGDCIHNARTALDYAVVRLWALVTGDDPREIGDNIQFPLYTATIAPDASEADIQKAWDHARDSFKTPAAKFRQTAGIQRLPGNP